MEIDEKYDIYKYDEDAGLTSEQFSEIADMFGQEKIRFSTRGKDGRLTVNIDKLGYYLINDYIFKNKKVNRTGKAAGIETVTFSSIRKLNLSCEELYYTLGLLDRLGIKIVGFSNEMADVYAKPIVTDDATDVVNKVINLSGNRSFISFPKYNPLIDENSRIRRYQLETDEEAKLELRNQIISNNSRLVPYVIRTKFPYIERDYDVDDIIQEAFVEFIDCLDNYDTTLDYSFSTYACDFLYYRIIKILKAQKSRGELEYFYNEKGRILYNILKTYKSLGLRKDEINIDDFTEIVYQNMYAELMNFGGPIPRSFTRDKIRLRVVVFLGETFSEIEDRMDEDLLEDDEYVEPDLLYTLDDEYIDEERRNEYLKSAMETLTPREKRVIELRFGFDGKRKTLEEVGKIYNLSADRIRQIEAKALRRMRHPARAKKLKEFL